MQQDWKTDLNNKFWLRKEGNVNFKQSKQAHNGSLSWNWQFEFRSYDFIFSEYLGIAIFISSEYLDIAIFIFSEYLGIAIFIISEYLGMRFLSLVNT